MGDAQERDFASSVKIHQKSVWGRQGKTTIRSVPERAALPPRAPKGWRFKTSQPCHTIVSADQQRADNEQIRKGEGLAVDQMDPVIEYHRLFGIGAQRFRNQGIGRRRGQLFRCRLQLGNGSREYPRIDMEVLANPFKLIWLGKAFTAHVTRKLHAV